MPFTAKHPASIFTPLDVVVPFTKRDPLIPSFAAGDVVPIPTLPALSTMKLVAVDDPITNAGPVMPFGLIESWAQGVEVPIPRRPVVEFHKNSVPPASPKRTVDDALSPPKSEMFVVVELVGVPKLVPEVKGKANEEPVPPPIHAPLMAKQPLVRLKPTLEVEVA